MDRKISWIIFIAIVCYASLFIILNFQEKFPENRCEGIGYFYTNTSFIDDFMNMEDIYDENYDMSVRAFMKGPILITDKTFSPIYIGKKESIDCEEFSNAVMCLSSLYSVECKRYSTFEIGFMKDEFLRTIGHVGVKCKMPMRRYINGSVEYKWEELF